MSGIGKFLKDRKFQKINFRLGCLFLTNLLFITDFTKFQHALICSSGVGCFLSVNTSLIVIVCNRRAALWGSVYLDVHGEEDRNLRLFCIFEVTLHTFFFALYTKTSISLFLGEVNRYSCRNVAWKG